jgi:hypothetical protein
MLTQTAERQELQRVIDMLPDNSVAAMLGFLKSLQLQSENNESEWADPIETGKLNAETIEALEEVKSGDLISFGSKEKLFKFLDS